MNPKKVGSSPKTVPIVGDLGRSQGTGRKSSEGAKERDEETYTYLLRGTRKSPEVLPGREVRVSERHRVVPTVPL